MPADLIRVIREYRVPPRSTPNSNVLASIEGRLTTTGYELGIPGATVRVGTIHAIDSDDVVVRDVGHCARCKQDHAQVAFTRLDHPVPDHYVGDFGWWAPCPTNGQPILLATVPKPEATDA